MWVGARTRPSKASLGNPSLPCIGGALLSIGCECTELPNTPTRAQIDGLRGDVPQNLFCECEEALQRRRHPVLFMFGQLRFLTRLTRLPFVLAPSAPELRAIDELMNVPLSKPPPP